MSQTVHFFLRLSFFLAQALLVESDARGQCSPCLVASAQAQHPLRLESMSNRIPAHTHIPNRLRTGLDPEVESAVHSAVASFLLVAGFLLVAQSEASDAARRPRIPEVSEVAVFPVGRIWDDLDVRPVSAPNRGQLSLSAVWFLPHQFRLTNRGLLARHRPTTGRPEVRWGELDVRRLLAGLLLLVV